MSPLGKYSQFVAAIVAVIVILAHIGFTAFLNDGRLENAFWVALGAVFGAGASTAITNGAMKRDLDSIHKQLDSLGVPHE